jgi:hypothetical protein
LASIGRTGGGTASCTRRSLQRRAVRPALVENRRVGASSALVPHRVFLLSPASSSGQRSRLLLAPGAGSPLAARLRRDGAPIGEVFSFLSSLYFRGKLTYAQRFAAPPDGCAGVQVITTDRGLVGPETPIRLRDVRAFARVPIDAAEPRYARPLRDGARALRERLPRDGEVVLLGSIATAKYVDVLREIFGAALLFPGEFVGRGDMSRGGLLLRAAKAGVELDYRPVDGAVRRGPRAVRLDLLAHRAR